MKNQINYNVTGSDRQHLVRVISKELETKATYTGAPEFAYVIKDIKVGKSGEVTWPEGTDKTLLVRITDALKENGFEPDEPIDLEETFTEPYSGEDLTVAEMNGLTISMPMDGFNPESLDRLQKLVDSKARLIKKALGAISLKIRINGDKVEFPWWGRLPEPEETQAYMAFIANLCAMAKGAKRVVATEKKVESEKFAFRVWLLRMGFNGSEYKAQRAILLKNLAGSAAFPNRAAADAFSAAQKGKREAAKAEAEPEGVQA